MTQILRIFMFIYPLVATFTHPLLPGSDGIFASGRVFPPAIMLREILTAAALLIILYLTLNRRLWPVYVFLIWATLLVLLDLASANVPIVVSIRSVIMITLCLLLPFAAVQDPKLLTVAETSLKVMLVLSLLIGLTQLPTIPGAYGTTFLGPRVFAATASPLHLSYAAGISAVFFATRRKPSLLWVAIGVFLTLLSGGRAGMLIALIAIIVLLTNRFYASQIAKVFGMAFIACLVVAAAFGVSNPEISGREGTAGGPLQDGRFGVWARALEEWLDGSILDVLFGLGVGKGSNSLSSYVTDFYFTDSAFVFLLLSFGAVGAIYIVSILVSNIARYASAPIFAAWLMGAMTQLYFELQPFCIILSLCIHKRYEIASIVAHRGKKLGFATEP